MDNDIYIYIYIYIIVHCQFSLIQFPYGIVRTLHNAYHTLMLNHRDSVFQVSNDNNRV